MAKTPKPQTRQVFIGRAHKAAGSSVEGQSLQVTSFDGEQRLVNSEWAARSESVPDLDVGTLLMGPETLALRRKQERSFPQRR